MTENIEKNMGDVSSRPQRNLDGTFAPGHRISVGNKGGRPRKDAMAKMLDDIARSKTAENLGKLMDEAAEMARKSGSSKALLNVAVAVADRILGKPVQTVVEASDGYEALAALMAGDDDANKDGD